MPSFPAIPRRLRTILSTVIRLKSYVWHLDRMVGSILCFSVVARMNIACAGGSSNVLKESIECGLRKHVHLIDDVHAVFSDLRRYPYLVHKSLDVIYTIVGSGIKFVNAI